MAVHMLAALPWTSVRDLASPRAVAVLPIGAVEAHGPHLPLATDVIIAEAMAREGARRLSARGFDVLLLPSLPFTAAPFAAAFPGTVDGPPDAVTALVVSIAGSLARHGVTCTVVANAHLDPGHVAALRIAESQAEARTPGARLVFPDVTTRRLAQRLTAEFRSGACHAGRYETSILLAERPEWVLADIASRLPSNPRSLVDAIRQGLRTFQEAGGADAYFGFPSEASADEGRLVVRELGAILEEAAVEVLGAGEADATRNDARRNR
jgi:creatinine amidohydrolase